MTSDDTGEMQPVGDLGELVVVTGMTGAGRSTAAKELEDLGYFVVDNLPPELVTAVVRLVDEQKGRDQPIAVVVDVRGGTSFHTLREQLAQHLPTRRTSLLFLEADDDILVRRQEAARRQVARVAPAPDVIFRPEEEHRASGEDNVLPPPRCRYGEVHDCVARRELAVADREPEW